MIGAWALVVLFVILFVSTSVAPVLADDSKKEQKKLEKEEKKAEKEQKKAQKNLEKETKKPKSDYEIEYRSIDGTGNNKNEDDYGSAGIELIRISPADYSDSNWSGDRPSAREVSNEISVQLEQNQNFVKASDMFWQWGQFLDHDIDLTPGADPAEPFNIEIPTGDPYFDPLGTGTQVMPFSRSLHNNEDPREQLNVITAFIDGSQIYGSDDATANSLRTFEDGKLKTSEGNLLPLGPYGFFLAGDVRANEQIGLTAMHTLFVREHNRIADEIKSDNPDFNDEQIYQWTRKIVGAELQQITYNEFLPFLLGKHAIPKYQGYDPDANPGIKNEFSTAAYRFGHTMLSANILQIDSQGEITPVPLRNAFFNPTYIKEDGIEPIILGLAFQRAMNIDTMVIDDVRNFLFGEPGSGGFDLAALNIQRGRDHGLADYNTVREYFGMQKVTEFDQITSDVNMQQKLESLYGTVDNVDLWAAGLAEDYAPGAMIGETFHTILVDQFTNLRDGDRFWFQNDPFFTEQKQLMKKIQKTTLSDIIRQNTDIGKELKNNPFICGSVKNVNVDKKLYC